MEELEVDRIENWNSLVRFDSVYIDSRVIMEIVYWLICHAFENVFIQVSNQIFLNMWNLRESPNKSFYVIPEYVLFRHIKDLIKICASKHSITCWVLAFYRILQIAIL